jgi:chemotaxis protein MotB
MEEAHHEIVIIRRGGAQEEEGHHGGAWKIAFADFMTAMMAFFLVLWIINATSKDTKTVIARYFNPVKLEDPAKAKKGIVQDSSTKDTDKADAQNSGQTNAAKNAPEPGPGTTSGSGPRSTTQNASDTGPATNPSGEARPSSKADEERVRAMDKEDALFADPYASLDRIASAPTADAKLADAPRATAKSMSDPFEPITLGSAQDLSESFSSSGSRPAGAQAGANLPPAPSIASAPAQSSAARSDAASPSQAAVPPPQIQAQNEAQISMQTPPNQPPAAAARESNRARAMAEAKVVARQLEKDIDAGLSDTQGPAVQVEASDDGLLISITDKMNFTMFKVGSAEPQARTLRVMTDIAEVLKKHQGEVIVRGFTDARPYASAKYDNWRLSSARAQMAYYMLVRGGVLASRFERIEGYGDRRLKDPKDPLAAVNRRIEILVRPEKP